MLVVADLVNIAGANAFLHVGKARARRMLFTEQVRNERVHTRRGKQNGGIVFGNKAGGRYPLMPLALEE